MKSKWLLFFLLALVPCVSRSQTVDLRRGAYCMNPSGSWIPVLSAYGTALGYSPAPFTGLYGSNNGGAINSWYPLQCDASGNLQTSMGNYATAPATCSPGQTYYNTTSGAPFWCGPANTWNAFGGSGTFTALSGDAVSTSTGGATTVKGINGVLLSGLATGPLCNTTTTGAPVDCTAAALVAAISTTAVANATTAANLSGTPALPNGTTATTQSSGDSTGALATDSFVATAVNNAIAGVNPAVAVLAASTATITGTYTQVGGGIGDTFTVTATGAFTLDGISINTIGQRVLFKNQTSANQNGVYTATVIGASLVSPVFTRALDYDTPSDVNNTGSIPVQSGTLNSTTSWLLSSQVTSIGSSGSSLTYAQFSVAPNNIVTASSPGVGICHFAGSTQACTSSLIVAADITNATITGAKMVANTVTATQLATQYSTWSCVDGLAGSAALAGSGWPAVPTCYNASGATWTITAIRCVVDGGSGTTIAITDGSANNLINAATFTCSTSWASATQSATTTIASGGYIKWTATPDGTAKAVTVEISGTY